MNGDDPILSEAAQRLLADVRAQVMTTDITDGAAADFAEEVWKTVEEAGYSLVSVPLEYGGSGGTMGHCATLVRLIGYFALPIPLAETAMLAGWLLSQAEMFVPSGPLTAAPLHDTDELALRRAGDGWVVSGRLSGIPWARHAVRLVAVAATSGAGHAVVSIDSRHTNMQHRSNLAGEPRDDVQFDGLELASEDVVVGVSPHLIEELSSRAALTRVLLITGALEQLLNMTSDYANERRQFGRRLADFQAVRHLVARLAAEFLSANAAARAAVECLSRSSSERSTAVAVAAARARAGRAAGEGAAIAHQIHGAIGFCAEHPLHLYSTRLWSWRDEFRPEHEWCSRLGGLVLSSGGACWRALTA